MGKPGEKMSSVIYFTDNMNPARVLDITRGAQNRPFKKPRLRSQWVEHLNKHVHTSGLTDIEISSITNWAQSYIVPKDLYDKLVHK